MTPRTLSIPKPPWPVALYRTRVSFPSFSLGLQGRGTREILCSSALDPVPSVSMSVCPGCLLSYKVEHGPLAHWPYLGTFLCSSRTQKETCMPKVTNSPSPGGLARTHVARPFPEFPSQ